MKKLMALLAISTLATTITFGATNEWASFKNAVKQDIKNTNASLKEAVKKDMEANKKAQEDAIQAKKTAKINEVKSKIADLNKQLTSIKNNAELTYTEKTLKTKAIEKQIEYYNKQLTDLQK